MTRLRIAFVDIAARKKTRSSDFFIELLRRQGEVDVFHLEADPRGSLLEIVDGGFDLIVCWQSEFCAPFLSARHQRVICVPMYDAVEAAPDWYWQMMRQARFVNFSRALHLRHRRLGIESYLAQYFLDPVDDAQVVQFDEDLRAVFWQRRPQQGLDHRFARAVLGRAVAHLHVHNAPDDGSPDDYEPDLGCTVSHFSLDGDEYRRALAAANVFLCPRYTEGIGLAMLDALSRGMCVVAHDAPSANEYIVSGTNGLLIDYAARQPIKLPLRVAAKLGRAARQMYLEGHQRWVAQCDALLLFVTTTPAADIADREARLADAYLAATKHFFLDYHRFMRKAASLFNRGLRSEEASRLRLLDHFRWSVAGVPGAAPLYRLVRQAAHRVRVTRGRRT